MTKRKKEYVRRAVTVLLTVCMLLCQAIPVLADEAKATTMRLSKTEGTVSVSNHNGKTISMIKEMKLYDGYHVKTEEASYAWIALDDTKAVKLDAVSEAEVQQKGKKLELLLNSGSLFFNVTAPLEEDEVLNIRTSTMVTGIRGTSGVVKVVDDMHTRIMILDGQVQCRVTDPVTGQIKEAVIPGGQTADLYVYEKQHEGAKCDIIMHQAAESEVDGFAALEIAKSPELQYRIKEASSLEVDQVVRTAAQKLQQDQARVWQQMKDIRYASSDQDQGQTLNSVFGEKPIDQGNSGRDDSGHDDSDRGHDRNDTSSSVTRPTETTAPEETTFPDTTGGSDSADNGTTEENPTEENPTEEEPTEENPTEEGPTEENPTEENPTEEDPTEESTAEEETAAPTDTVEFTMPVTAAEIQKALQTAEKVKVHASADSSQNHLSVDTDVRVPEGKMLEIGSGIQTTVESGATLQIDGTLDAAGNVTNQGTINNTSVNTFIVAGELANEGTMDNSGRLKLSNPMANRGNFVNTGSIEGTVSSEGTLTVNGGSLEAVTVSGGTAAVYAGTVKTIAVSGGNAAMHDGTVTDGVEVRDKGRFTMNGGTVLAGTANQAVLSLGAGTQTILSGGVVDGEEKTAVSVVNGDVEIKITAEDGAAVKSSMRDRVLVIEEGTADGEESAGGAETVSQNVKINGVPWSSMPCQVVSWQDGKAVLAAANGGSVAETLGTAAAGDEIVILKDCSLTEKADGTFESYSDVTVKNGTAQKPVVLDLNGKELYVVSQKGSSQSGFISLSVAECGALKICDTEKTGKFIMGGDTDGQTASVEEDGFEEDRVRMMITGYVTNNGDLTFEGCQVVYSSLVIQKSGNLTISGGAAVLPSETLNTDDGAIWMIGGGLTVEGDDTAIHSSGSMGTIHFESGFKNYDKIHLNGGTICNNPNLSKGQERKAGPAFSWEKSSEDGTGKVTAEELNEKFPKEILTVVKGKSRELFSIGNEFNEENPYAPMGYLITDTEDTEGYYHLVKQEEGETVVNLTVNASPAAFLNALATSDRVVVNAKEEMDEKCYFAIENMKIEIPTGKELVISFNVILQIKNSTTFVVNGVLTCEEMRVEGTVEVAEGAVVNGSVLVADGGSLTVNGGTIDGGDKAYAIKMEGGSLTIGGSAIVTSGYSEGTVWFAGPNDDISVQFNGGNIYNRTNSVPVLVWEVGDSKSVGDWLSKGEIKTGIKGKDANIVRGGDWKGIPEGYSVKNSDERGYVCLIKTSTIASMFLSAEDALLQPASPSNASPDSLATDLTEEDNTLENTDSEPLEKDPVLLKDTLPTATPGNAETQEGLLTEEQGDEDKEEETEEKEEGEEENEEENREENKESEPDSSSVPGAQWVDVPQTGQRTEPDAANKDDREDGEVV